MSILPASAPSVIDALNIWLEGAQELPYLTDEERHRADRALKAEGLSIDRLERGGVIYTLRKVIELLGKASREE